MCGRYTYYPGEFSDLRIHFNLTFNPLELVQRFNIAPGQTALMLRAEREAITMDMLQWGLVPS